MVLLIDLKKFFAGEAPAAPIDYSFSLPEVQVDGVFPFVSPITAHGELRTRAGAVELTAELRYDFSMPCSKCMEETLRHCVLPVKHTLVRSLEGEEDESYIPVENDTVDLRELFYSDLILEIPIRTLCREDCKGLCPSCGKNLNEGPCGCSRNQVDPRFEILKKLIDEQ